MSVKFSHNTNTPTVLRPGDMNKIVQLHPPVLNELPHIGVWTDRKTLLIIFPAVNEDQGIDASELKVEFILHAGKATKHLPVVFQVVILHCLPRALQQH